MTLGVVPFSNAVCDVDDDDDRYAMVLFVVVVIECSRARGSMVVVINPARQVGIVITAENWYSRLVSRSIRVFSRKLRRRM